MAKIIVWFFVNNLSINASEIQFLIYHTKQRTIEKIDIHLGEVVLEKSETIKFLVIHLTWNAS